MNIETMDNSLPGKEPKLNLAKYFDEIYDEIINSGVGAEEIIKNAEMKITKILQNDLNNPQITAEIDSDDTKEMLNADWSYYPYIRVFDSSKNEIGNINPLEENSYDDFINKNKLP